MQETRKTNATVPHAISPFKPHLLDIHGALRHKNMNMVLVTWIIRSSLLRNAAFVLNLRIDMDRHFDDHNILVIDQHGPQTGGGLVM